MLRKNQPANFHKTDYQTLPITYTLLLFDGHAKRLCLDPMVGLRARLHIAIICLCGEEPIKITKEVYRDKFQIRFLKNMQAKSKN